MQHVPISPSILYWGTPVVLISTTNDPATDAAPANIGPMSSCWWLGHRCMLGLDASSATTKNLIRTRQCVLNLPSDDMASTVNAIARTTGTPELPPHKAAWGYRYEADKFAAAGLTPVSSTLVGPPRIAECPVAMECEVKKVHDFMGNDEKGRAGFIVAIECEVVKVWVDESLKMQGHKNRVDPDAWRPMIMSFQELYGLSGKKKETASTLARIEEENYRGLSGGGEETEEGVNTEFLPKDDSK